MTLHRSSSGRRSYRKTVKASRLVELFRLIREEGAAQQADRLLFVCIGTDRSSGDALGPLTGTLLQEAGFPHVIGTLERPCDADTMPSVAELQQLADGRVIVAIDAGLGQAASVGRFQIANQPLLPGQAVRGRFGPIGDYSIAAIVEENRAHPVRVLETTPLGRVLHMARAIVQGAAEVFPPLESSTTKGCV